MICRKNLLAFQCFRNPLKYFNTDPSTQHIIILSLHTLMKIAVADRFILVLERGMQLLFTRTTKRHEDTILLPACRWDCWTGSSSELQKPYTMKRRWDDSATQENKKYDHSSWLKIQRPRVRFLAPHFLIKSSGTGSIPPREDNWAATWMRN
jgi:hypothetical protein